MKAASRRQEERIDARISRVHKDLLKRAADLSGQPVSQFLVASAVARAQQVVDDHLRTKLAAGQAKRFLEILDEDTPNAALTAAVRRYRARRHA
jgi:uncharacterized protein (DUF1778 family)